jgi:hypothetical protein
MALYTLRFPDYATAKDAATALGFWNTESDTLNTRGNSIDASGKVFGWAIDDIGQDPVIAPGEYDEEGKEITPPTKSDGYFVNVTGELPPGAEGFIVPYGSAGRLFAGTVAEVP